MTTPIVTLRGAAAHEECSEILTPEAAEFLAMLHDRFEDRRLELLDMRTRRQRELSAGDAPRLLAETQAVREATWTVNPAPADLEDRRCEITGPTDRRMIINALNSGARVFMADFEDANVPTWSNMADGQRNLLDAVRNQIDFTSEAGKEYRLGEQTATLMVRPRGWHLTEDHVVVSKSPISASLFDFGLYFFHNALELVTRGSGPYFYLPKLESHLEARLWNDVFVAAQDALGVRRGTIKATVLIETILAAYEMDEILYELRHHSAGLNAGRWDYIFSIIKKFRNRPDFVLPDRASVTMTVPFMAAYSDLLVATCHRRGAHAIGGMAAFIPNRRDPEVTANALGRVRQDKEREARAGFDGSWVAHPDLVPVASGVFDAAIGDRANQLHRLPDLDQVDIASLSDVTIESGVVTLDGLRTNVDVAIRYLAAWLDGRGAVAIYNLMEDTATAEISRSQVWHWIRHAAVTEDGTLVTRELVRSIATEELDRIRTDVGDGDFARGHFSEARDLFEAVALDDEFPEFLTTTAYERLETAT